jgi:predicted  nucleic acid-binding Zn-ribbon protein
MSGHGFEELNILNGKIDDLLKRYISLKDQVSVLKAEHEAMKNKLHDREEEIKEIEKKYERVRLTGALLGEGENAREAKRKITEMVREIDRCIALLNR